MNEKGHPTLTKNSRLLRKNMTKQERHLWYDFLKLQQLTIRRQKVLGNYIVDFYCASKKLVIEIDGSQHYYGKVLEQDQVKENYFRQKGLTVLRYSNREIDECFESVCQHLSEYLK